MRNRLFILIIIPLLAFSSCMSHVAHKNDSSDTAILSLVKYINDSNYEMAVQVFDRIENWDINAPHTSCGLDVNKADSFLFYLVNRGVAVKKLAKLHVYIIKEKVYVTLYQAYLDGDYEGLLKYSEEIGKLLNVGLKAGFISLEDPCYMQITAFVGNILHQISANGMAVPFYIEAGQGAEFCGKVKLAENYYLKAKELHQSTGLINPNGSAILLDLGTLYWRLEQYDKSETYLLQALDATKIELGYQTKAYAGTLSNLGSLYQEIGEIKKAILCKEEAAKISSEIEDEMITYARLMYELSSLYEKNHEYEKHKQAIDIACRILSSSKNTEDIYRLIVLQMNDSIIEHPDKIEKQLLLYLELIAKKYGKHDRDYLGALTCIGIFYEKIDNFEKAEEYYLQAQEIFRNEWSHRKDFSYLIADGLGHVYISRGEYKKAEPYVVEPAKQKMDNFIKSIDYMTYAQREKYWGKIKSSFEKEIPLFSYLYYPQNKSIASLAYDNELFLKGILLRSADAVRHSILESKDSALIRQWNKWVDINQEILYLENRNSESSQISSLREKSEMIEKEMTKSSVAYRELSKKFQCSWTDIQKILKNNEVAIEFMSIPICEDSIQYCALLLRKKAKNPIMIPLFEAKEIKEQYSVKISEIIKKTLLPYLKEKETVYFAPTSMLHKIPFENLPYDSKRTLGEVFNLVRLSSTRELIPSHQKQEHNHATLFGGIKYNARPEELLVEHQKYESSNLSSAGILRMRDAQRSKVGELPGTKVEVEKIEQILTNAHTYVQCNQAEAATEESFKALNGSHQNIIHLATHGFYWQDSTAWKEKYFESRKDVMPTRESGATIVDPLECCGLLFAGANTALAGHSERLEEGVEDGVLTAREISMLDLRGADIVVLSACETGDGFITSEGVYGLQRSFKMAGAQTLIVSLWKVDDEATQVLMTEFYKNWIEKRCSKHDAFRSAQKSVRERFSDPKYWAGFIILD